MDGGIAEIADFAVAVAAVVVFVVVCHDHFECENGTSLSLT